MLLGNAAHPMLQYLAQGACQALEDAACVSDSINRHDDPGRAFLVCRNVLNLWPACVPLTARFFGELLHVCGVGATLRNTFVASHPLGDCSVIDQPYACSA